MNCRLKFRIEYVAHITGPLIQYRGKAEVVSGNTEVIQYGWPCIDGQICNGNFITGQYWNE